MKIIECGRGEWEETEHRLDYPHPIPTTDFKVTGSGHERIAQSFDNGCRNGRLIVGFNDKQPEHRIAAWLCRNATSFVLFDTKARCTVIGFERDEDAEAFRSEFAGKTLKASKAARQRKR